MAHRPASHFLRPLVLVSGEERVVLFRTRSVAPRRGTKRVRNRRELTTPPGARLLLREILAGEIRQRPVGRRVDPLPVLAPALGEGIGDVLLGQPSRGALALPLAGDREVVTERGVAHLAAVGAARGPLALDDLSRLLT